MLIILIRKQIFTFQIKLIVDWILLVCRNIYIGICEVNLYFKEF